AGEGGGELRGRDAPDPHDVGLEEDLVEHAPVVAREQRLARLLRGPDEEALREVPEEARPGVNDGGHGQLEQNVPAGPGELEVAGSGWSGGRVGVPCRGVT